MINFIRTAAARRGGTGASSIRVVGALIAMAFAGPHAALAATSVSSAMLPTLRTITIDGQFADWNQVLLNPLQVSNDGNASVTGNGCYPTNPDRDCPSLGGNGRDVLQFAWTYDTTNVFTYLKRDGNTSAVLNYFFIMDLDADGFAESTDRVAQVRWSGGGNTISYVRIWDYVPANGVTGDPMACGAAGNCPAPGAVGYVDGYSMPGMLGATPLYDSGSISGGSTAGDRFEVNFPWAALGKAPGSPIFWHVSSATNASFNPALDNAGGPDGKLGTFGAFAMTFTPDRSGGAASPGTIDYCHTVANIGQFDDAYNLAATSSSASGIALYAADAACNRGALIAVDATGNGSFADVGDTAPAAANDSNADGIPDTGTVIAGASQNVIFQLRVGSGLSNSTDRLRGTATSIRRATQVTATVIDTTAIGPVSVFPNLSASGTPGLNVLVGRHTVQNNQAAADNFDLKLQSQGGWAVSLYADNAGALGALIASDSNGDGTWDSVAPTTGTLASAGSKSYWVRAIIPAAAAVGSSDRITVTATSRTNPALWGSAVDVVQVMPALQLVPSYTAPSSSLVGPSGGLVYLAHRLVNSQDVAETVSLSQTGTLATGYTIKWFTDPDGDGNPADGAQITGAFSVPPFGGVTNLVTEIAIPIAGAGVANSTAAVTTAVGTRSSASADDHVSMGNLLTFRDPLYTLSDRTFAACSTLYVQADSLTANTSTSYSIQLINPANGVAATVALPTDSRGSGRASYAFTAADAPGSWKVRLMQGATQLRELTPIIVERSGTVTAIAPALAQNGQLLAVSAQLSNTNTQSEYTDTRVDFQLRDPNGNVFRTASVSPVDVAFLGTQVVSRAWAAVPFPQYGTYTLTVTWSTACGSVINADSKSIQVVPPAPVLTSPPHNSVVTTATPSLQGTAAAGAAVSVYVDGLLAGTGTGANFSVTPAALSQGAHSWYATQTLGGLASAPSPTFVFTVDSIAPDTTIISGPANGLATNVTAATFGFSSPDATAIFECSLDGAAFTACTSPASYSGLPEGPHAFAVRARDPAGNVDATPASRAWTIDLTAPDTTVSGPASPTNATTASLSFGSPDVTATFECSLDGATYAGCASPTALSGLAEGPHTFDVRATDSAGNTDPTPARYSWTIDLTPPDTAVSGPASPSNSAAATLTFSSPDPTASFECALDGAAYAACTSPLALTGLAEGPHTFDVRAKDPSGNFDPTPARHSWTIDLTAPDSTVTGPASPTSATAATLTFSSPDATATFECSRDGAAYAACTSPVNLTGLTEGTHTFDVRARDTAGNIDPTPARHTWTIDLTAPDTTVTGPASPTNATTASFTFASPDTAATFECSLDGGAFTVCTSPASRTGLAAGSHTFDVRARDTAGNFDLTPARHSWTIDLTPPDTTLSGPPALTNLDSATLTFSATEAATFECSADGAVFSICTSPVSLTNLADGPHTFRVRATDTAGNLEVQPASHGWTVDTTPPDTTITSAPPATDSSTDPSFSFDSSEAGSTFLCSLDGGAFTACSSPVVFSALANGPHTFAVYAVDPATNPDPSPATHSWSIDTSIPDTLLTATPPRYAPANNGSFSFGSTANPATFDCGLDGSPLLPCTSPLPFTGLADGDHTFTVRSKNAAGTADPSPATWLWTVDTVAPDTTVNGPASPAASGTATLTFAASEGFTSFRCRLDGAAFAACTTPAVLTGLADGSHDFDVYAVDRAGNVDATPARHTWTVDTTPPDTSVSGPPARTNATGASFTFASADSGASFECSLDGAAYSVCTSPGSASGLAEGSHTFDVRAVDTAGNADPTPAHLDWTVDLTPPDTTVSGPASPTNATVATLTFAGLDVTDSFTCSLDGAAFAACTSPLALTGLAEGPHTFAVIASDDVGNADPTPATHAWTVDLTPPNTTVSGPASPVNVTTATLSFAGADGSDTFECSVDGAAFAACTTPAALTGLAEGPHTFDVRATDLAGNTDPTPARHAWTVDLTAPQTSVTGPASPTNATTAAFGFGSDDGAATFTCSLDGEPAASCAEPYSRTGLTEGPHVLAVTAHDLAGNADPSPAEHRWTVDLTPPDTTLSGPPALTNLANATLTFSATEGATFECSHAGAAFAPCTSPVTLTGLADGAHTFEVRATDTAGNPELTAASHGWTVDTTPPDTAFGQVPAAIDASSAARFAFASPDDAGASFECSLDGAAFTACVSPVDLSALTDGPHAFEARAVDAATNPDPSPARHAWTVDTSIPDTTVDQGPPAYSASTSAQLQFSSTASPATFECQVDGQGTFQSCVSPVSLSGLADGPHRLEVQSRNAAGTVDPTPASYTWRVDTLAPDTTLTGPQALTSSTTANLDFDATETGVRFECSVDGGAFATCTSPLGLTALAEGTHLVEVRAIDQAGNVDATPAAHSWTIDLTDPDTTIVTKPAAFSASMDAAFSFSASEPAFGFECSLDGSPFDACDASVAFSALGEGSHTLLVRAIDLASNTDATPASYAWEVDLTAPDTSITASPAALVNTASADFVFTSSEDPNATFECSVDAAAFAACATPFTLTVATDGTHTFSVRAIDRAGNVDGTVASAEWAVDTVAPVATFTQTPPEDDRETDATFAFTSSESGTLMCRLDGAAAAPCQSPFELTGLSEGAHVFEVYAIDAAGNVQPTPARHDWTIKVDLRFVGGGCGCGTSQGGASAFLGFGVLALILRRQRRGRRVS